MDSIIRDPSRFAENTYDLIIIGGGIYGVMLALEASQRGLKSLLLEKSDFGGATTFNCLRIIHGGLRYLQTMDLKRSGESVAERKWFLKAFPDLVKPIPCLMPLYGQGLHRPSILKFATLINDVLSINRNRGVPQGQWLPSSGVLDAAKTKDLCSLINPRGLKAGVVWYDAVMPNSQRVVMETLRRACRKGALVLNYVEVSGILKEGDNISGVLANDRIDKVTYAFASSVVINATGPWSRKLAADFDGDRPELFRSSIAWNVLFNRPAISTHTLAIRPQKTETQTYFLVPWKNKLLAGTGHAPWPGKTDSPSPDEPMLNAFINDLNLALPGLNAELSNILHVFSGLLPVQKNGGTQLTRRDVIINHAESGGPRGLYSVSGVKFTTARLVAEKMMKHIFPHRKKYQTENEIISAKTQQHGLPRGVFRLDEGRAQESNAWQEDLRSLIEAECVQYPDDLIFRRTNIWEYPEIAASIKPQIQKMI